MRQKSESADAHWKSNKPGRKRRRNNQKTGRGVDRIKQEFNKFAKNSQINPSNIPSLDPSTLKLWGKPEQLLA